MRCRSLSLVLVLSLVVLVGVGPASAENVALLINETYVDYADDGGPPESEAANLEIDIAALGHTVTTFTSIDAGDLTALLATQDVLVIPEFEGGGDFVGDLSMAAAQAMVDFVTAGGTLIEFNQFDTLNNVFGFTLNDRGGEDANQGDAPRGGGPFAIVPGNAAGTTFAGGPALLQDLSATQTTDIALFPTGGVSMYDNVDDSVVWVAPVGEGWVGFLGWDWFQGDERGGDRGLQQEFADWNDVLDRMIRFARGREQSVLEVPTAGAFGMAVLALGLLGAGLVVLRRL